MIKRAWLLSSLLLSLPALASEDPVGLCQSIKDVSANTMGAFYSVKAYNVNVVIKNVYKPEGSRDVTSDIEATHLQDTCSMTWLTSAMGCTSQLKYISCKSKKELAEDQARMQRIRSVFKSRAETSESPPSVGLLPDAS